MVRRYKFDGEMSGFTLIEALVVLAILSILAAISGTAFEYYVVQSKNAEVPMIIDNIAKAEVTYFNTPYFLPTGERGSCFLAAGRTPAAIGSTKRPWVDVQGGFTALGVKPPSQVYYSYQVLKPSGVIRGFCDTETSIPTAVSGSDLAGAYIIAEGDLNGDNTISVLGSLSVEKILASTPPPVAIGPGAPGFDPDRCSTYGTNYSAPAGMAADTLFVMSLMYSGNGMPSRGNLFIGMSPSCTGH